VQHPVGVSGEVLLDDDLVHRRVRAGVDRHEPGRATELWRHADQHAVVG
jgi:hypothetical protein